MKLRCVIGVVLLVLMGMNAVLCCLKLRTNTKLQIVEKDDCFTQKNGIPYKLHGRTGFLYKADSMCLEDFGVFLYADNLVLPNVKRKCIFPNILKSANTYLSEQKIVKFVYTNKVVKMIVFLDAVRKFFMTNASFCFEGNSLEYNFEKFVFDQNDIDDSIKSIVIYLSSNQTAKDVPVRDINLRYLIVK